MRLDRRAVFWASASMSLLAACAGDDLPEDRDAGADAMVADAARDAGRDAGCAPGDPSCEAPSRCRDLAYFDGEPDAGLTVPGYAEGEDVEYVFGFQGGVMVQPVVELPASRVGDEPCVLLEVRNAPHPDFPEEGDEVRDFPSFTLRTLLARDGEVYRSTPLDDQIGWSAPDGRHIQVEIIARGLDWAQTTGPLGIRLVDADGFQECDRVRKQNTFGCVQHVVPAGYEILGITGDDGACEDRATLTLALEPDDAEGTPSMCFPRERELEIQAGCVAAAGLSVGQTGMLEWRYVATPDTCSGFPDPEVFGLRTDFCCP